MTIEIKKPIKRQRTDTTTTTMAMAMVVSSSSHDHDGDQENPASNCFLGGFGGYECKTCRKRFKSYQALGGHQGIHKKVVKPAIIDENYDECELRLVIVDPLNNKSSFGMHRCKQCMKEFDSGQALGGHMRRHQVEKDLALKQQQEEKIARRQQAAAASDDQQGKSDLTQEPEQVISRPLKDDYESRRKMIMRSELMLAAKEWRLGII